MNRRYVFDQFPLSVRFLIFGLFLLVAGYVGQSFPTPKGLVAIPVGIGALLLLARQVLIIDGERRMWWYRRGLWPILMVTTPGTFEQLYGISIGVSRFERSSASQSGDGMFVSNYSATLYFQDDFLSPLPLYSGRDFGQVAEPAATLAHSLGLPMMLSHDLQWRSEDLAKYQAEAANLGT